MILARLLMLSLLSVVPLSACGGGRTIVIDGRQLPYDQAAAESFAQARDAYAAGRYDESANLYTKFLETFADSELADEARLRRGEALAKANKTDDARAAFTDIVEKHPESHFKKSAALELSVLQAKSGQPAQAQALKSTVESMSEQEKQQAAPALAEAFAQSGEHGESARWGAKALEATQAGPERDAAKKTYESTLANAPGSELAKLVAELDTKSPAYGPAALRLARIQAHTGDRLHAQDLLAQLINAQPTGADSDQARELLQKLQSTQGVNPVLVGVVLPLTGDLKPYADSVLDAIALRLDLGGKGTVQVMVKDSKNDPEGAMKAVEDLAKAGVIAILGPIGLVEGPAAAVRAQQLGVPMISLSRAEGIPAMGPYIFRDMMTNSIVAKAVADYAQKKLNAHSFGILQPDSPYGDEMTRFFWDALDAGGAEVRAFERYPRQTTTFKPFVSRMVGRANLAERAEYLEEEKKILAEITDPYRRRKALQTLKNSAAPLIEFDALFVPDSAKMVRLIAPSVAAEDIVTAGCDERELAVQKKTMKKDDLRTVQLIGTNLWDSPDLVDEKSSAGRYVQCAVFVDGFFPQSQRPATHQFVDEFDQAYKRAPGYLDAHAHDAAGLLKDLIERKKPQTRDALRDMLAQMDKAFPGATGDTKFGPDREVMKPLFWLWVTRGSIQEFDPEGAPPVPPAVPQPAAPAPTAATPSKP
ncbi:MAG: penicillin-binding protein activator [Deltaproteobacteria bacterium]|nr:penicillin-binding protein activator [Deltaproteobacteria bacterium]